MYITSTKEVWTVVTAKNGEGMCIARPVKMIPDQDLLATAVPYRKEFEEGYSITCVWVCGGKREAFKKAAGYRVQYKNLGIDGEGV